MGEDAATGAVRVVGLGQFVGAHALGGDGQHDRRFGIVGVPVGGVGAVKFAHAFAERRGIDHRDHQVVVLGAQHLQGAAQRRGVGDMRIDDEQAANAAVNRPVADLLDQLDQRDRLQRERAGPAPAVAERTAVGQRGQHGHAGLRGDGGTELLGDDEIDAAPEMRAMLLGGSHR